MNRKPRLLVVEDQASERRAMARLLSLEGYDVVSASGPAEALAHAGESVDLAISDLRMGAQSGIDLMRQWKARHPETPFVMVTAYADVDSAVAAMKLGAKDYLSKPVDPESLLQLVARLLAEHSRRLHRGDDRDDAVGRDLIGDSPAMREVRLRIERARQSDCAVLVTGESGAGKESAAEAIHYGSRRRAGPFVVFNSGSSPEGNIECELFGERRGSKERAGVFRRAEGGTLFIDEIGECPWTVQAKLLRALETQKITPVGAADERSVAVRLIASTSRDLRELVAARRFQEDLYYGLDALAVDLPPLRQRSSDVPLLIDHFLNEFCRANQCAKPSLAPSLQQFFEQFAWPGNVRQLRHTIESMVVVGETGTLTLDELPPHLTHAWNDSEPKQGTPEATLENLEKAAVLQALERTHGNRTHAASALGISIRTLQRKLKAWGLSHDR